MAPLKDDERVLIQILQRDKELNSFEIIKV